MLKKILLTGSNGLLGQKIIDQLRYHTEYELIASSKGENRYPKEGGYIYENLDVCNPLELERIAAKYEPYAIIHTAAMTNVDQCESEREQCDRLNVDAVRYLIDVCKKRAIYFVHMSTDFVFDGKKGMYEETDAPNPLSYYGSSKLKAEELLLNSSIDYSILRTIIVYGLAANMSRSNIVLWAKSALEKGDKIKVVNDQFRMPTLAEDLADACVKAVDKRAKGIYHVSGKDYMSVIEMVRRIAKHYELNEGLIEETNSGTLNQAAVRPPNTGFKIDKAIKELGYAPHSFEEGLDIVRKQLEKK